jgi:hypothetical protein
MSRPWKRYKLVKVADNPRSTSVPASKTPRRVTHCWKCDKPLRKSANICVIARNGVEYIVHHECIGESTACHS